MTIETEFLTYLITSCVAAASAYGSLRVRVSTLTKHVAELHTKLDAFHDKCIETHAQLPRPRRR
jgi:hypothetical protein